MADRTNVGAAAAMLARRMIAGDLRLWRIGAEGRGVGDDGGSILVCRRMGGRVVLERTRTNQTRFLFARREEHEEVVAHIRARFSIEPVPEGESRGPGAESELALLWPDVIESAPEREKVVVRCEEGPSIELDLRHRVNNTQLAVADLIRLVEAIAAWRRRPREGRTVGFSLGSASVAGFGPLIAEVSAGFDVLRRGVEGRWEELAGRDGGGEDGRAIEEHARALVGRFPVVATQGYRLADARVRVLVRLDKKLRLTWRARKEWVQFDVEAQREVAGALDRVRFTVVAPDVLTGENEMHGRFLRVLRSGEVARSLRQKMNQRLQSLRRITEREFAEFLDHASQEERSVIARLEPNVEDDSEERRVDVDRDLVLLRGPMRGRDTALMFTVNFEVERYPDVHVRHARDVRWVCGRSGFASFKSGQSRVDIENHMRRLLRVFPEWDRVLDAGVAG